MTPESHTLYSLFLFSALVALQHWVNRRNRASIHFREGAAATLMGNKDATGR